MMNLAYKRVILKLSGEALAPAYGDFCGDRRDKSACFDARRVEAVADALARVREAGVELGVVIGGGNIWRGRFTDEMNAVNADQMGMLATVMNALAVQDALTRRGARAAVLTAQAMDRFAALYTRDRALELLQEGAVVLLAGGSGHPFFTTDTAAALRAAELDADAIFKGTTVSGVYDSDPRTNPNAALLREITYREAVERGLKIMDQVAFILCREQKVPCIRVFSMDDLENIVRVVRGEQIGTIVHE